MSQHDVARVLVVDDEPHLQELLVDALTTPDVHVTAVGSGAEALNMARREQPDLIVADICLGDCTGLEVIDELRTFARGIPAVIITGYGDAATLFEASRRHPLELLNKPLDLNRLRRTVHGELDRQARQHLTHTRRKKLRQLARETNLQRKHLHRQLELTCSDLAEAYQSLSGQMEMQQVVIAYQHEMLRATNDDDIFRSFFRVFVSRSGPLFGVAMLVDENAEMKIAGRFGVPHPDGHRFCTALAEPVVQTVLARPEVTLLDAWEKVEMFDQSIRRYLVGVSVLAIPLMPQAGEIVGMVALYRKGEQPFIDEDLTIADIIATPTAMTIRSIG